MAGGDDEEREQRQKRKKRKKKKEGEDEAAVAEEASALIHSSNGIGFACIRSARTSLGLHESHVTDYGRAMWSSRHAC